MFLLPHPSFHLLASYDMATVLCLLLMLELGPESLPVKFGILTVSSLILGWIIKTPLLHKATVYLQNHTKKVEFNLWPQLPQTEKTPKCTRGENSWVFASGQCSGSASSEYFPILFKTWLILTCGFSCENLRSSDTCTYSLHQWKSTGWTALSS